MYALLWRLLPGPLLAKLLVSLLFLAAVVALLFLYVFPWLEPRLPFLAVTVEESSRS